MAEYNKPIPSIDPYVSKPFWDGAKEGKLMLPRCCSCNKCHWYPRIICPFCYSSSIEWIEGSGEGTFIHSLYKIERSVDGQTKPLMYLHILMLKRVAAMQLSFEVSTQKILSR